MKNALILLILLINLSAFSQTYVLKIDSLQNELQNANHNQKADLCLQLAETYSFFNNDSSLTYSSVALEYAIQSQNTQQTAKAYYWLGRNMRKKHHYEIALNYLNRSFDLFLQSAEGDSKEFVHDKNLIISEIGIIHNSRGRYDSALHYFHQVLESYEQTKDQLGATKTLNNIGTVYESLQEYKKAIDYYERSLKINEELGYLRGIAAALNNIGGIYYRIFLYDESLDYFERSLQIKQQEKDSLGISKSLNNIGTLYHAKGNIQRALSYIEKAVEIDKAIDNKKGAALKYANIGMLHEELGNYSKAVIFLEQSLKLANEIGDLGQILDCHTELASIYEEKNEYKKALFYFKKARQANEKLYTQQKYDLILETEAKYQSVKNEEEIQAKNQQLKKQLRYIYILVLFSVLIIGLAVFAFQQLRIKRKANELLRKKKDKIERQKAKIEKQYEVIDNQNQSILSSINYARFIQSAVLPSEDYLKEFLPESFVFFKPRDIVSGDFYWMGCKQNPNTGAPSELTIIAADCTGHGVPGGFLSMLGISFINELANNSQIKNPGDFLNKLHQKFQISLSRNQSASDTKDGMDIAMIRFAPETMKLQYAGAHNPLFIIRDDELLITPADKFPIGIELKENQTFTNHDVQLQDGDCVYIFSDGFADQFGGKHGKKFLPKRFRELILSAHKLPMSEQPKFLKEKLSEWQGNYRQIDDILVIGFRVSTTSLKKS